MKRNLVEDSPEERQEAFDELLSQLGEILFGENPRILILCGSDMGGGTVRAFGGMVGSPEEIIELIRHSEHAQEIHTLTTVALGQKKLERIYGIDKKGGKEEEDGGFFKRLFK